MARYAFLVLAISSVLILFAIITWGSLTSVREGAQTISSLLADSLSITIMFGLYVTLYIAARMSIVVAYTFPKHEEKDTGFKYEWDRLPTYDELISSAKNSKVHPSGMHIKDDDKSVPTFTWWFTVIASVFGVLQLVSFNLVGLVRVTEWETPHYVFALGTTAFSVVPEVFLVLKRLGERSYVLKKASSWTIQALFITNVLLVVAIFALGLAFAVVSQTNPEYESTTYHAMLEYGIFYCTGAIIAFEWLDVED